MLTKSSDEPKKVVTPLERRAVIGSLVFMLVIYAVLLMTQFG